MDRVLSEKATSIGAKEVKAHVLADRKSTEYSRIDVMNPELPIRVLNHVEVDESSNVEGIDELLSGIDQF